MTDKAAGVAIVFSTGTAVAIDPVLVIGGLIGVFIGQAALTNRRTSVRIASSMLAVIFANFANAGVVAALDRRIGVDLSTLPSFLVAVIVAMVTVLAFSAHTEKIIGDKSGK